MAIGTEAARWVLADMGTDPDKAMIIHVWPDESGETPADVLAEMHGLCHGLKAVAIIGGPNRALPGQSHYELACKVVEDIFDASRSKALEGEGFFIACGVMADAPKVSRPDAPPPFDESGQKPSAERISGWRKIADAFTTAKDIAKFAVNGSVGPEEYQRRKSICEGCTANDSVGDRLFREYEPGVWTCGASRWTSKLLRATKTDGCGCVLNSKWSGKGQSCPLGRW